MGNGQFGSSKNGGAPFRSWALRTAVVAGVVAFLGELVRTWGETGAEWRQTTNEILGQPASTGASMTTVVGETMLGVGGAVAVIALTVWLVQQLRS